MSGMAEADAPGFAATPRQVVRRRLTVRALSPRRGGARHSRLVALLKFLLPIGAAALIAVVAVWPSLQKAEGQFRIGFATIQPSGPVNPSMINARYVGTDSENQPFQITADLARNLGDAAASIELDLPKADLGLEDGAWVVLTADTGLYRRDAKTLDLKGGVNVFHDTGYEIRTEKATIDLAANTAAGDQPVQGHGPFGELTAQGFRLFHREKRIVFTGKASLTIFTALETAPGAR